MKQFFIIIGLMLTVLSIFVIYRIAVETDKDRTACDKAGGEFVGYNGGICLKKDAVIKLEGK